MEKIPIRRINTARQEPGLSENFAIREIEGLLAGKDMVQELHRHDFFYVLVLEKGRGEHIIDFTPYRISNNAVFFMRPGQVHRIVLKTGSSGYLLQFTREFYSLHDQVSNQLLRKTSSINHYQLHPRGVKKILAVLTNIFQEYTDKQERYQEVIKANMSIFFIELARQHGGEPSDKVNLYMQERFDAFLERLEVHVSSHKQVAQYAAMLNLSAYQLNAVTKATVGKNCSAIINDYIILEAKKYLLATAEQVNQIAGHLGYEDVSYFIRFFKKHTGYSPESFRHNF